MDNEYKNHIEELNMAIQRQGDVWELYNERGFWYFLDGNEEQAKADYKRAMELGLDPVEQPYYAFSASNRRRRDFILPEKIMVFLILIMVLAALAFQVVGFILKVKGVL